MNYIAEIKCKNGMPYVGFMNRAHCSTNCALHDYKNQPSIYAFPITGNYVDLLTKALKSKNDSGLHLLQFMGVKNSIKHLKNAILTLQKDESYDSYTDEEESNYFNSTPKNVINALTHLKEMAEECVDKTCIWEIKETL